MFFGFFCENCFLSLSIMSIFISLQKDLKCPNSILKQDITLKQSPIGYEVVKELWSGSVISVQKQNKEKFTIPVNKEVNTDDIYDMNLPYAGYKKHEETSYMEDMFLAFRCPTTTYALCAQLPYE